MKQTVLNFHSDGLKYKSSGCFTAYNLPSDFGILREGIYQALMGKVFANELDQVPHLKLSQFEAYQNETVFYRLKTLTDRPCSKAILLLNLNPSTDSIEHLQDLLRSLKRKWIGIKQLKIVYQYSLDLISDEAREYLRRVFSLLHKELGYVPEAINASELELEASFEGTAVIEGCTEWSCLDNYFVHLILSKGGTYLSNDPVVDFSVLKETELSPFHSLQIIQIEPTLAKCPFWAEATKVNFAVQPERKLFYFLCYKNIY